MAGREKREQKVLLVAYIDLDRASQRNMDPEDIVDERLNALRETPHFDEDYGIFLFRARPEDLRGFSLSTKIQIPSVPLLDDER
jgi:hypothetical protein